MASITGINHVTLSVHDLDASFAFYRDVLGFRPRLRWVRGAYLSAGSLWLALLRDPKTRVDPLPEYTHVAFDVNPADFEPVASRIRASGAPIWQENTSEGASLYFCDPNGHKLELHASDLEARLAAVLEQPYEGAVFFDE